MALCEDVVKRVFILGLCFSLISCGSDNVESQGVPAVSEDTVKEEIITPATATVSVDIQLLFDEDIAENLLQSTPEDVNFPLGLKAAFDIEYKGAFRVIAEGESNSNFAVGALGYNPDNNSIYMAGHSYHNAIAEFAIPSDLSLEPEVINLPHAAVLQDYVTILDKKDVGRTTDRINGILYYDQNLLVSSEIWYDASAQNTDNLQVFTNAMDLASSNYKGMLKLEGAAKAAGYMSKVPAELVDTLGTEYLVGWASNYSITSRYSQGPSLYRFNPRDAIDAEVTLDTHIATEPLMVFPLAEGTQLVEGGNEFKEDISPIWGPGSQAMYGFIVPNTHYFLAVGRSGGLHSGYGYKITQDNGNLCGGPCPYESADVYNYYWLFDINDMLTAEEPWLVRPVSYGKWSHPYDESGAHVVIGGTFDEQRNMLYLALSGAGQVANYDRPPLIVGYQIAAKSP